MPCLPESIRDGSNAQAGRLNAEGLGANLADQIMKTTRREFLATAAGLTGTLALGSVGWSREAGATETGSLRLITYHGLRPTDPGGRLGLRNPERGWRIETVIAESARKTFGPAHHLAGKVSPLYQEDWWMLDAARFEPFGLTLVQAYC